MKDDKWRSVSPLAELELIGGTIPKISKCMFFIDEKHILPNNDAERSPQRSQSKSNLHCQKTQKTPPQNPKPPKQQKKNKPC